MIIAHVYHHYYPFLGGLEKAIQYLAEEQAKLGHEVHVITSTYGAKNRPNEEHMNSVYIHRVKAFRFHYPDLTIPKAIPIKLIKEMDIVHVHSHNSLFSIRMLNEAFKLGVKNACYFMAVDTFSDHPSLLIRFLGPYYGRRNTKRALKMTNLVLVRSMRDGEILSKIYGADTKYLPDAIPDYYFTNKKGNPDEFREKFGIRQELFFLYIGRIHKLKGPHILVKALKYINEDIAVVFIGPDGGHLKKTLDLAYRIGVKDRVYILGYVSEGIKIHALDSAIALILPSIADYVEVYPMVITEAWAREKPVVASKVGGVPYRIRNRVNGILVEPSDPKILADAMLELVGNKKLTNEMGRNGKKDVLSWNEIASRSIELYRQVLRD